MLQNKDYQLPEALFHFIIQNGYFFPSFDQQPKPQSASPETWSSSICCSKNWPGGERGTGSGEDQSWSPNSSTEVCLLRNKHDHSGAHKGGCAVALLYGPVFENTPLSVLLRANERAKVSSGEPKHTPKCSLGCQKALECPSFCKPNKAKARLGAKFCHILHNPSDPHSFRDHTLVYNKR